MRANYKMQRLFVPDDLSAGVEFEPDTQQSHYLMHVLRLADGAELLAFTRHRMLFGIDPDPALLKARSALERLADAARPNPAA